MRSANASNGVLPAAAARPAVRPSNPVAEIGPSGCPLCGGWMWIFERASFPVMDEVTFAAPPAATPGARELSYRCSRCRISCSYWMAEDGSMVALERH